MLCFMMFIAVYASHLCILLGRHFLDSVFCHTRFRSFLAPRSFTSVVATMNFASAASLGRFRHMRGCMS